MVLALGDSAADSSHGLACFAGDRRRGEHRAGIAVFGGGATLQLIAHAGSQVWNEIAPMVYDPSVFLESD
jgi:hypothetical protein